MWRMYAPHKVKFAVSGCPRNCAEAGIKDVGIIGVDSGWEMYIAGNGGIKTEVAHFFTKLKTAEEVLEYTGAFMQLYRLEGWYLERTVHYVSRVGLDHVKKRILGRRGRPQARCGRNCSSRCRASPILGSISTRPRWTCVSLRRWRYDLGRRLRRGRHPRAGRAPRGPPPGHGCGRVPHRHRRGLRLAGPLPAQGWPPEPRHRGRPRRGLPAAQLDHRAGHGPGRGARRRLHAALCGSGGGRARAVGWHGAGQARAGPGTAHGRALQPSASRSPRPDMETKSTCPYCGVGCGVVIEHDGAQITGVRGDPDHPANFGRLCTKGTNLHRTATPVVLQGQRLRQPLLRAGRGPGAAGGGVG